MEIHCKSNQFRHLRTCFLKFSLDVNDKCRYPIGLKEKRFPLCFSRINFHNETVERFKNFALTNNENYTETMEVMLDFFEKNQINPFVPFDNSVNSLTILINKRMDAVESILREIENRDLLPTRQMLESLFVKPEPKKPIYVERRLLDKRVRKGKIGR